MNRYVVLLIVGIVVVALSAAGQDATDQTVWDGVYSSEQAERGMEVYSDQCALCHASAMTGSPQAPALTGPEFMFGWGESTVGELFDRLQTSMPPGSGALPDRDYVEIIAAILRQNSFPEGDEELIGDLDSLNDIRILREAP